MGEPPLKIAQVCPYDLNRPGGVKSHIFSLKSCLEREGHSVKVIAPNTGRLLEPAPDVHLFGKSRSLGLGGTTIDVNFATGREYRSLRTLLETECFDIIHYHTMWNPFLPLQVRWNSGLAKNVATFHDTPKSKLIGLTLMPMAATAYFRLVDQVISVSPTQARYLTRFTFRKISIIPNGIDLDEYRSARSEKTNQNLRLLFLGRLEPRKGILHALKAFDVLKKRHPKIKLTIVGDGSMRDESNAFVESRGLADVEFLGFVDHATKLRLLAEADVFLAPSLYGESFGIVLLEAMAAGTPIVGYGNEGYQNVINDQIREFFPLPGDLSSLTAQLEKMIMSPQTRNSFVEIGNKIVQEYDIRTISERVSTLYRSLFV